MRRLALVFLLLFPGLALGQATSRVRLRDFGSSTWSGPPTSSTIQILARGPQHVAILMAYAHFGNLTSTLWEKSFAAETWPHMTEVAVSDQQAKDVIDAAFQASVTFTGTNVPHRIPKWQIQAAAEWAATHLPGGVLEPVARHLVLSESGFAEALWTAEGLASTPPHLPDWSASNLLGAPDAYELGRIAHELVEMQLYQNFGTATIDMIKESKTAGETAGVEVAFQILVVDPQSLVSGPPVVELSPVIEIDVTEHLSDVDPAPLVTAPHPVAAFSLRPFGILEWFFPAVQGHLMTIPLAEPYDPQMELVAPAVNGGTVRVPLTPVTPASVPSDGVPVVAMVQGPVDASFAPGLAGVVLPLPGGYYRFVQLDSRWALDTGGGTNFLFNLLTYTLPVF